MKKSGQPRKDIASMSDQNHASYFYVFSFFLYLNAIYICSIIYALCSINAVRSSLIIELIYEKYGINPEIRSSICTYLRIFIYTVKTSSMNTYVMFVFNVFVMIITVYSRYVLPYSHRAIVIHIKVTRYSFEQNTSKCM